MKKIDSSSFSKNKDKVTKDFNLSSINKFKLLSVDEIKKKIIFFEQQYRKGNSIISDYEFDYLVNLYYSKTNINYENMLSEYFKKYSSEKTNSLFINSIRRFYSIDDLKKYFILLYKKVGDYKFYFEEKIDGIGIFLVYIFGELKYIFTKGEKKNLKPINKRVAIQIKIPINIDCLKKIKHCSIRGELVIKTKDFNSHFLNNYSCIRTLINAFLFSKNYNLSVDNLFISFIKHHDIELGALEKNLSIDINRKLDILFDKANSSKEFICNDRFLNNFNKFIKLYISKFLENSLYPCDGIVFKVSSLEKRLIIGNTSKCNNYFFAFKNNDFVYKTYIQDIEWNIGRLGNYIPKCKIATIELINEKRFINFISLHNLSNIIKNNIFIKQTIKVSLRSSVIPHIVQFDRYNNSEYYKKGISYNEYINSIIISNCKFCGSELERSDIDLKCINSKCLGKLEKYIIFLFEKLNISSIGSEISKRIFKYFSNKLENYNEIILFIFRNKINFWVDMTKGSIKTANKIFSNIRKVKKQINGYKIFECLNIHNISKLVFKKIIKITAVKDLKEFFIIFKKKIVYNFAALKSIKVTLDKIYDFYLKNKHFINKFIEIDHDFEINL